MFKFIFLWVFVWLLPSKLILKALILEKGLRFGVLWCLLKQWSFHDWPKMPEVGIFYCSVETRVYYLLKLWSWILSARCHSTNLYLVGKFEKFCCCMSNHSFLSPFAGKFRRSTARLFTKKSNNEWLININGTW